MPRLPADPFIIHWREPEVGYWRLYSRWGGVLLPSRIWLCDHVPYEPDNKLDRGQAHLAGEIGGRWVPVDDVWWRVLLCETRPRHWKVAHPLIPKEGLTVEEEFQFQMRDIVWLKKNDRGHPLAQPYKPVKLSRMPLPF